MNAKNVLRPRVLYMLLDGFHIEHFRANSNESIGYETLYLWAQFAAAAAAAAEQLD